MQKDTENLLTNMEKYGIIVSYKVSRLYYIAKVEFILCRKNLRERRTTMLFVLSEIDCLDYLNDMSIYPDAFFTDIEMFKNKIVVQSNVDVLVIFAGSCRFSKRLVSELVTQMRTRITNQGDDGIKSVTVISDTELKHIDDYYIYYGRPSALYKVVKKKIEKNRSDVLNKYVSEEKPCNTYLVEYDCDKAAESVKERFDKTDELLQVIQVPQIH